MLALIGKGICYFLSLIEYAILFRAILSWFMDPYSRIMQIIYTVTEPFLAPIRALIAKIFGGMPMIDFSPVIGMMLISFANQMLMRIFF